MRQPSLPVKQLGLLLYLKVEVLKRAWQLQLRQQYEAERGAGGQPCEGEHTGTQGALESQCARLRAEVAVQSEAVEERTQWWWCGACGLNT